ncbi:MAG: EscU/YscU/HrcU family type III secretion system export apparatus switch protein [Parvularculaceae bacterium]|nr:EscU/YscU/HrcU family type III secretion system export apparatus switch protein [Parvularculaceae bacterium]
MSEESGQDKSFDPTPSRLERARREGDMPISRDATGAAAYAGLFLASLAGAVTLAPSIAAALSVFHDRPEAFFPTNNGPALRDAAAAALAPGSVFLATPAAFAAAALVLQQSVVIAPVRLKIKLSRLSPAANAKHKFGPDGLADFLKGVTVLGLIAAGLFAIYADRFDQLPGAAMMRGEGVAGAIASEAAPLIGAVTAFSFVVGMADLVWVRLRRRKRLMMSLEEVRRDAKETDGDPHFKSARRERAKAIATNKMLADVPKANVVIVNPEHYAVALKWDGPNSGPPVCVAKGVDKMADKIRALAAESGVPIRRDPPTARAIYAVVDVGEEIRREHFAAIAAAIHFADTVRRKARAH